MLKLGCCTIITLVMLMFIGSMVCAETQPHRTDSSGPYAKTIDKLILKCENKIGYRHSRSNEMQLVAALSVMKSAYLREYKTQLIQEMKLKNIVHIGGLPPVIINIMLSRTITCPVSNIKETKLSLVS